MFQQDSIEFGLELRQASAEFVGFFSQAFDDPVQTAMPGFDHVEHSGVFLGNMPGSSAGRVANTSQERLQGTRTGCIVMAECLRFLTPGRKAWDVCFQAGDTLPPPTDFRTEWDEKNRSPNCATQFSR